MRRAGFLHDPIDSEDYQFGSVFSPLPRIILQADGNWLPYLPEKELQAPKFEVFSCVSETMTNVLEILAKKIYGFEPNHSARFVAKNANTEVGGTSPKSVFHSIRHAGTVPESDWSTVDALSFNDYYKDIPKNVLEKGLKWLEEYEFQYENVPLNNEAIKDALSFSPLGISVPAWSRRDDGLYYRPEGARDNHFTTLVDCKWGEYWLVFDTYFDDGSPLKKLAWDIKPEVVKRFHLQRKGGQPSAEKQSFWSIIKGIFRL